MLAFMTKTLASVNEDLKAGKTVVVTVAGQDAAPPQAASEENAPDVHAVTTATFESAMHRIPLPAAGKTREGGVAGCRENSSPPPAFYLSAFNAAA